MSATYIKPISPPVNGKKPRQALEPPGGGVIINRDAHHKAWSSQAPPVVDNTSGYHSNPNHCIPTTDNSSNIARERYKSMRLQEPVCRQDKDKSGVIATIANAIGNLFHHW